ncbi:MAG TPA: PDZ domain-containing protein, partial [Gemmatimonadaceae bacterium]|nr:PDZ domain-containing protein [Gemmatimonadaceae bacterium]
MTPGTDSPAPVWHYAELPRVAAVRPGGAAATAGVQEGDTIVLVDSLSILSPEGARRFSAARPGGHIRLTLRRAGRIVNVELALGQP